MAFGKSKPQNTLEGHSFILVTCGFHRESVAEDIATCYKTRMRVVDKENSQFRALRISDDRAVWKRLQSKCA